MQKLNVTVERRRFEKWVRRYFPTQSVEHSVKRPDWYRKKLTNRMYVTWLAKAERSPPKEVVTSLQEMVQSFYMMILQLPEGQVKQQIKTFFMDGPQRAGAVLDNLKSKGK